MSKGTQPNTEIPSKPLLAAMIAEKSGVKGMRLVVQKNLLDAEVRAALKEEIVLEDHAGEFADTTGTIPLVKRLKYAHAPANFEDVLWMVADRFDFLELDREASTRLRWAATDPEASTQAAMTKVVFEEVRALARFDQYSD